MEFISERAALTTLSETLIKCSVSLFNGVKYIYSLSAEDFYDISIKDCLKVLLHNITDADCLQTLSLRISADRCAEMSGSGYDGILALMIYSFAIRLPLLKRVRVEGDKGNADEMTDEQIKNLYEIILEKGGISGTAIPNSDVFTYTFQEMRLAVKRNKPIPEYSASWYKQHIRKNIPALSAINNRTMFVMGAVDVLFPMFEQCLQEELMNVVRSLCSPRG